MTVSETPPAPTTPPATARRVRWQVALIVGLLLLQLGLGVATAREQFVTHDEYWHLPVGLRVWQTGWFGYDNINPPLTRVWAAMPAALAQADPGGLQRDQTAHEIGLDFLRAQRGDYLRWYVWGRIANLCWSLLAGALIARWSWQWWGGWGACLSVLAWVTEPTVMGHSALVTPDAGLTCLVLATWFALWRYTLQPGFRRALAWGVCCGLAQLCKFTAVLLWPLSVVALGWWLWSTKNRPRSGQLLGHVAVALVSALFVWNAGYGFQGTGARWGETPVRSRALQRVFELAPWGKQMPLPVPKLYLEGLDGQQHILEGQHPVYLNGAWTTQGFRSYFVWALLWKLSLPWLWLLFWSGASWVISPQQSWSRAAWILGPTLLLFGIASNSGMQLGLRYILPVFPLLCLGIGSLASSTAGTALRSRVVFTALLIGAAGLPWGWLSYPHSLSYFNEFAGGMARGGEKLLDSNLDWGQDLHRLQQELAARGVTEYSLAYFGAVPPGELGMHYTIPSTRPVPGWHALSVNSLYGRPHVLQLEDGTPRAVGLNEFSAYRRFQPVARLGGSIWLYHLTPEDITAWLLGK